MRRPRAKEEPALALVADPPWKFGDKLPGPGRGAEKHYRCMPVEEIEAFPVPEMLPDSVLFLWRVSSMVEEALRVARAWGFVPKAEVVWVKTTTLGRVRMGMGRYVRNAHEACIVATRGRFKPSDRGVLSVVHAPRGRHSAKPDAFYAMVERLAAGGPLVELFARTPRPGWRQHGDQLEAPP